LEIDMDVLQDREENDDVYIQFLFRILQFMGFLTEMIGHISLKHIRFYLQQDIKWRFKLNFKLYLEHPFCCISHKDL
jgi:hypothetical protein